jgi:hypothetical protein
VRKRRKRTDPTSPIFKPGSKVERLYNWLKREMVGAELLFTSEHARTQMGELSIGKPEFVWNMLQSIEGKGLISRKKRRGEKGIIVSFVDKNVVETIGDDDAATTIATSRRRDKKKSTRKGRASLTVDELVAKLQSDVERLTAKKGKLDRQIKQKNALIDQLIDAGRR